MRLFNRIRLVFSVILIIWLTSLLIHVFERQSSFDINNIQIKGVQGATLIDEGINGTQTTTILDKDTLNKILILLKKSKTVNFSDVNVKANIGACSIILKTVKGNELPKISVINTSFSGAIIESGDYCYRNDSLLNYIRKFLK